MSSQGGGNVIEQIPDPQMVRHQLVKNLRERRLLRSLLRISEKAVEAGAQPRTSSLSARVGQDENKL